MTLTELSDKERTKVVDLLVNYWKERGMPEYDIKYAREFLIEGHKKEIKRDDFFVYKVGEEIVGTVSLITDVSNVAEIRDAVIKPEFRMKGHGKRMLEELLQLAKERNLRKVFTLVKPVLAKKLEENGFAKEGVLKSHFAEGEDLVIMSKFL